MNKKEFLMKILGTYRKTINSSLIVSRFVKTHLDKSYTKDNFIQEYSEQEFQLYEEDICQRHKYYKIIPRKDDIIVLSCGYTQLELESEFNLSNTCIPELYIGERLNEELQKTRDLKERYGMSILDEYLKNPVKDDEVCTIYGLRRTGKSYMMLQSIGHLQDRGEKAAYFLLHSKVDIKKLKESIEKLIQADYKYIYLDEVTFVEGILDNAVTFTDGYAGRGIHIVLSGTDSYILRLFESEALGRVIRINTTFISYKEYCYLKGGQVSYLKDYLQNGGIFKIDECYISSHGDKNRKDKIKDKEDYVQNAIVDNLRHSIISATSKTADTILYNLALNKTKFSTAVEKTVAFENRKFLLNVVTSKKEIGSFVSIIKNFDINIDESNLIQQFNNALSIDNYLDDYTEDEIDQLRDYLVRLNVLTEYKNFQENKEQTFYLYTQPGLRYRQLKTMLEILKQDPGFLNVNVKVKNDIIEHIVDRVEGPLLEHNVICHILYEYKNNYDIQVSQYNIKEGGEFDLVIGNRTTANLQVFEIKRGDDTAVKSKWYQWLLNENNICDKLIDDLKYSNIVSKCLLFNGTTNLNKIVNDTHIKHLNVEKFLLDIEKFIEI